jgi:hypothetical protein
MVTELNKSIKPKKLKVDKVRLKLLNELRKEGRIVQREFEKTVRTWQGERPKFEVLIGLTGKDATAVIGPTGSDKAVSKWTFLDEGTKPHAIKPKKKPALAFRSGFQAKTTPNLITSSTGGSFGPFVHLRKGQSVKHPGIKPRNWTKIVVKQRSPKFAEAMSKAAAV